MKNKSFKYCLHFIPLIILVVYAVVLTVDLFERPFAIKWKHIIGFIVLPINFWLLVAKQKFGIVTLGFTLFLGIIGLLSYDINISTTSFSFGKSEKFSLPIFYGQPIFISFLIIHFIISGKYYFGILTKDYWKNILVD